ANVGRFTAMVSEMSEQVQFLFVTHNKATMEAAQQLSGVTMREPGVRRLVSVDLAEAARLVGAARGTARPAADRHDRTARWHPVGGADPAGRDLVLRHPPAQGPGAPGGARRPRRGRPHGADPGRADRT